ncbi:MAG: hypothetical protein U1F28_01155 [Acinetobacter sp.]
MAYVVFASPIQTYTVLTAAQQIQNHALYNQAILKTDAQGRVISGAVTL